MTPRQEAHNVTGVKSLKAVRQVEAACSNNIRRHHAP